MYENYDHAVNKHARYIGADRGEPCMPKAVPFFIIKINSILQAHNVSHLFSLLLCDTLYDQVAIAHWCAEINQKILKYVDTVQSLCMITTNDATKGY